MKVCGRTRCAAMVLLSAMLLLSGCASTPKNIDNICAIFDDKPRWHKQAKKAVGHWGGSVPVLMSMIYQESSFVSDAKPPMQHLLWVIPIGRKSDARGFAQAKKDTWRWYQDKSGNRSSDRENFGDAVDFVAWYNRQSASLLGIAQNDAYRLYLAYHEGHGGYRRGSYKGKAWLTRTAQQVASRARNYQQQYSRCD